MWWLDKEVYDITKNSECEKMGKAIIKCNELNMSNDIYCNKIIEIFKNFCKKDNKLKDVEKKNNEN
jgi:hypothetical protein